MDIDVAGQVLVEKLVEQKLVKSYADLYRLHERADKLAQIPVSINSRTGSPISLGAKRAETLLNGVAASKQRPLARLLAALNIRHVGGNTAEVLAEHFGTMDKLAEADSEALQEVEGIGPEVAAALRSWFDSRAGQRTIEELKDVGVNMTQPRRRARTADTPLTGKTVVVTGTLAHYSRKEIEDRIRQLGGKPTSSVSKNTDYVVAGESPGSKIEKARKLGVTILDEPAFDELISQ